VANQPPAKPRTWAARRASTVPVKW
jgi:hypothetical protein